MSKIDSGGAAFPRPGDQWSAAAPQPGMTLRDWFAGRALAGILAFPGSVKGDIRRYGNLTAATAYQHADAMLKAREDS